MPAEVVISALAVTLLGVGADEGEESDEGRGIR